MDARSLLFGRKAEGDDDYDFTFDDVVAVLKLPLPLGGFPQLGSNLEVAYGPGLRMVHRGRFLVVVQDRRQLSSML